MSETVTLFNDAWYDEIIAQTRRGFHDDTSPDAHAVATGIMVAGCCIAQSIDHLGEGPDRDGGSIRSAIEQLAAAVDRFAEGQDQ